MPAAGDRPPDLTGEDALVDEPTIATTAAAPDNPFDAELRALYPEIDDALNSLEMPVAAAAPAPAPRAPASSPALGVAAPAPAPAPAAPRAPASSPVLAVAPPQAAVAAPVASDMAAASPAVPPGYPPAGYPPGYPAPGYPPGYPGMPPGYPPPWGPWGWGPPPPGWTPETAAAAGAPPGWPGAAPGATPWGWGPPPWMPGGQPLQPNGAPPVAPPASPAVAVAPAPRVADQKRPAVVVARDIDKFFDSGPERLHILNRLCLEVGRGSFEALMGPSGSGKSTLLNILAGLERPTSGSLVVGGITITDLSEDARAAWRASTLGIVFQSYNLIPVLTALENVILPLRLTQAPRREWKTRAQTALRIVGLEERWNHFPKQLSGGQEQRVAIARAIVNDPALIIADEPTGDLDRKSADEVLDIFEKLARELDKTIIMVTHDPNAAARAFAIHRLNKGTIA